MVEQGEKKNHHKIDEWNDGFGDESSEALLPKSTQKNGTVQREPVYLTYSPGIQIWAQFSRVEQKARGQRTCHNQQGDHCSGK